MAIQKIYIHIGMPKVGSTSIQDYLFCIQDSLKQRGILYPNTGLSWHGHHDFAGWFQPTDARLDWLNPDDSIDYVKRLQEEAEACDAQIIFLSSEAFSYSISKKNLQRMRALLSTLCDEIEIVCFFRRQDLWVESAFTQAYKSSRTSFDFWAYANNREELLYNDFLFTWEDAFGINRIKPILMDKTYGFTDALTPICSLLDLDQPQNPPKANERLSIDALHFCHHWHLKKGCVLNGLLVHDLGEYSDINPESRKYCFFKPEEREEFLKKFEEDNQSVALRYFGRHSLFSKENPFEDFFHVDTTKPDLDVTGPASFLLEKHGLYETKRGKRTQDTALIWYPE